MLKSDTDKASQQRFEDFVKRQCDRVEVDRHAVYKAAHIATQGRITSVNEACHLVLGLPTVLFSRGNNWIPVGNPNTWSARVDAVDELCVLNAVDQGASLPATLGTMPAALKA